MEKAVLKKFRNIHRKVADLQLYQEETPALVFSSESSEVFNTYFEEHLLTAASYFLKQLQNSSEHLLLHLLFY